MDATGVRSFGSSSVAASHSLQARAPRVAASVLPSLLAPPPLDTEKLAQGGKYDDVCIALAAVFKNPYVLDVISPILAGFGGLKTDTLKTLSRRALRFGDTYRENGDIRPLSAELLSSFNAFRQDLLRLNSPHLQDWFTVALCSLGSISDDDIQSLTSALLSSCLVLSHAGMLLAPHIAGGPASNAQSAALFPDSLSGVSLERVSSGPHCATLLPTCTSPSGGEARVQSRFS